MLIPKRGSLYVAIALCAAIALPVAAEEKPSGKERETPPKVSTDTGVAKAKARGGVESDGSTKQETGGHKDEGSGPDTETGGPKEDNGKPTQK